MRYVDVHSVQFLNTKQGASSGVASPCHSASFNDHDDQLKYSLREPQSLFAKNNKVSPNQSGFDSNRITALDDMNRATYQRSTRADTQFLN